MTLRREEAQTNGRHGRRIAFGVSVICCDAPGCREVWLVGIGEGDDLPADAADDATSDGWTLGYRDHCPTHAAQTGDDD